jgi:hypothetical protein
MANRIKVSTFRIECWKNWCKGYRATGDWWICLLIRFCDFIDNEIEMGVQIRRVKGRAGFVEIVGEGTDRTGFGVEIVGEGTDRTGFGVEIVGEVTDRTGFGVEIVGEVTDRTGIGV